MHCDRGCRTAFAHGFFIRGRAMMTERVGWTWDDGFLTFVWRAKVGYINLGWALRWDQTFLDKPIAFEFSTLEVHIRSKARATSMARPKHQRTAYGATTTTSEHHKRWKFPHPLSPMETHIVATVGEFVGTFLFLYFAYAGNLMAASLATTTTSSGGMTSETVIFISLAYSFSLLVNVWAFYRISGGLFNPAVCSPFRFFFFFRVCRLDR